MNSIEQTPSVPLRLSWLKRIVRYGIHLIILYEVVTFSTNSLPHLLYKARLLATHGTFVPQHELAFAFSNLLAFSVIPAFLVGFILNAKFRHEVAEYIWVVPVAILGFEFIFNGPGMYPTMLGNSDFPKAFQFFFGGGLSTDLTHPNADWVRVYAQITFTMPAYASLAYSLGAFLGIRVKTRALRTFVEKL
jgi:hypothetical protein